MAPWNQVQVINDKLERFGDAGVVEAVSADGKTADVRFDKAAPGDPLETVKVSDLKVLG